MNGGRVEKKSSHAPVYCEAFLNTIKMFSHSRATERSGLTAVNCDPETSIEASVRAIVVYTTLSPVSTTLLVIVKLQRVIESTSPLDENVTDTVASPDVTDESITPSAKLCSRSTAEINSLATSNTDEDTLTLSDDVNGTPASRYRNWKPVTENSMSAPPTPHPAQWSMLDVVIAFADP